MILPIVAYGHPTLRKIAQDIDKDYPELSTLIENMWETMYRTRGVGLAAPQVNKSIRLFVIDATPYGEDDAETKDFKKIFINAQIIQEEGEEWAFNEGCLSLPNIREDVMRKPNITIRYLDENFEEHTEKFSGIIARIIQHEYDHLEGKVFVDRINNLRKMLLKRKLTDITKGIVDIDYRMIFPQKR
ncbi:MAG: peptide deformylase [Bacteroidales bacterium]|jgi:peptide deformylase|nr:peptide deformylase [Bacteroidales bacterium]